LLFVRLIQPHPHFAELKLFTNRGGRLSLLSRSRTTYRQWKSPTVTLLTGLAQGVEQ
jgi:hypothetical protein